MLIEIFTASKCVCSALKRSSDLLLFWKKVTGIILFFFPLPLCGAAEMGDRTGPPVLPTAFPRLLPPTSQLCPARSLIPLLLPELP